MDVDPMKEWDENASGERKLALKNRIHSHLWLVMFRALNPPSSAGGLVWNQEQMDMISNLELSPQLGTGICLLKDGMPNLGKGKFVAGSTLRWILKRQMGDKIMASGPLDSAQHQLSPASTSCSKNLKLWSVPLARGEMFVLCLESTGVQNMRTWNVLCSPYLTSHFYTTYNWFVSTAPTQKKIRAITIQKFAGKMTGHP